VAGCWLGAVGVEKTVPDRQVESEVAVGFGLEDRVVNAMHVGRDHEPAQKSVQRGGDEDVAVVEHGGRIEQNLKKEDTRRRRADRRNRGKFNHERQEDFDGVKARAGGDIDIEIGMVHAMEPPQDRLVMKGPVLKVNHEIEHEDGSGDGNPARYRRNIEQTPAVILHPESEADRAGWNEEPHNDAIDNGYADVGRPARAALQGVGPTGKQKLAGCKKCKDPKVTGEPNKRFVFEECRSHGDNLRRKSATGEETSKDIGSR